MIQSGSRMCILAHNEFTTDQPEFVRLAEERRKASDGVSARDFWDARAASAAANTTRIAVAPRKTCSVISGDPYAAECILIHEFAHNIHLRGMSNVDPSFDGRGSPRTTPP